MHIHLMTCGIFEDEWNAVREELQREFGAISTTLLDTALHVDLPRLKSSLVQALAHTKDQDQALFFGGMCHPEIKLFTSGYPVYFPPAANNCIDLVLSKEGQRKLENGERTFFLTPGWVRHWFTIARAQGWDPVDMRLTFGYYDKMLVLDTGVAPITDEQLLAIYGSTQVPIDVETISLDYFKQNLRDSISMRHKAQH